MSVDMIFWESEEPLEDEDGDEIYARIMNSQSDDRIVASTKLAEMAREIERRWPMPANDDDADEWPFAANVELSDCQLQVCLVPSRQFEVGSEIARLGARLELVHYDPQQEAVFLPTRLSRKRTRVRAKKKAEKLKKAAAAKNKAPATNAASKEPLPKKSASTKKPKPAGKRTKKRKP